MEIVLGSWLLIPVFWIACRLLRHVNRDSLPVAGLRPAAIFATAAMLCFLMLHTFGLVRTGAAVVGYGLGSTVFFGGCVLAAYGLLRASDIALTTVASIWVGYDGGFAYFAAFCILFAALVVLRAAMPWPDDAAVTSAKGESRTRSIG